ncbi:hypothetical protein MKX03_020800, partial [Papaver bracteatum]
ATGEEDVTFKVLNCGICPYDLHGIKNEWSNAVYPMVLGWVILFLCCVVNFLLSLCCTMFVLHRHEIVGVVTEVGSKVGKYKVGDKVGVGCMVGACRSCDNCKNDLENYCPKVIYTKY